MSTVLDPDYGVLRAKLYSNLISFKRTSTCPKRQKVQNCGVFFLAVLSRGRSKETFVKEVNQLVPQNFSI